MGTLLKKLKDIEDSNTAFLLSMAFVIVVLAGVAYYLLTASTWSPVITVTYRICGVLTVLLDLVIAFIVIGGSMARISYKRKQQRE